jgi:hypothetical protein
MFSVELEMTVIFQDEQDIVFERSVCDEVNPSSLDRTAGANEGVTLQFPIPQAQAVGRYNKNPDDSSDFGVTV